MRIKKNIQKALLRYKLFQNLALKKADSIFKQYIFKEVQTDKEREDYFRLRYDVYCIEKKYLPKNKYPNELEKDKYDSSSKHFIVKFVTSDKVVGAVRIIMNQDVGVQAGEYVEMPSNIDLLKLAEISRFLVKKEFRSSNHEVNFLLGKGLYEYSLKNGIEYWIAVMYTETWRIFSRIGLPFITIAPPIAWKPAPNYNVVPLLLNLLECMIFLKHTNPFLYRLFTGRNDINNREVQDKDLVKKIKIKMIEDRKKYWNYK